VCESAFAVWGFDWESVRRPRPGARAGPSSLRCASLRPQAVHLSGLGRRGDLPKSSITERSTTMNKMIARLRSILRSLATKANLKISVALSVPGFLKVEVSYSRNLDRPPEEG
jgi:arginase family enzyme